MDNPNNNPNEQVPQNGVPPTVPPAPQVDNTPTPNIASVPPTDLPETPIATSMPTEPPKAVLTAEDKGGSAGPVIASIIIIILIIIGGLYFWGSVLKNSGYQPQEMINPEDDSSVEELSDQGTSSDIADIEADASATDIDGLDAGFEDIEAEFDAQ